MATRSVHPPVAPEGLWERPDMADALARRDIGTVLKIFRRWTGASQTAVGMAVGIAQPHVSAMERGERKVESLDMFERFSAGLGIPRTLLGLADADGAPPDRSPQRTPVRPAPGRAPATTRAQNVQPADGIANDDPLAETARQSIAFLRQARPRLDPIVIEQFTDDVTRLSTQYLGSSPEAVIPEATQLRARTFAALEDGRRPGEMRDLYLIAGQLSGILAYAALDLDRSDVAMSNARTAFLCADMAGHEQLAAWTRGTQSLIARYVGRHLEAHRFLKAGLEHRASGSATARLLAGEAQCYAHFGDAKATHGALERARESLDSADPDDLGGLFTFTSAKLSYYAGSSLIWLPDVADARTAETAASEAIRAFAAAPAEETAHADEVLAHIYLATARVLQGEIDGVLTALTPILSIPPQQRISWHGRRLDRIAELLQDDRYRNSAAACHVRDEIDDFRREAIAG